MFPLDVRIGNVFIPFYEGIYFLVSIAVGLVVGTRRLERQGIRFCKEESMRSN